MASPAHIEDSRHALDKTVQRRAAAIAHLRELQTAFDRAAHQAAEREREMDGAAATLATLREEQQAARHAGDEAAEQLFAAFIIWRKDLRRLQVAEPDSLLDGFRDWTERGEGRSPFEVAAEAALHAAERALTQESTVVEMRECSLAERAAAVGAEIERLEGGVHLPPPPPYTRVTPRDGREGAPLWRLCDFRPGISDEAQARIEAALEASGLLDAWLQPDGSVINPETQDTLLVASSSAHFRAQGESGSRYTLDQWLEPATPDDDDGPWGVSAETVRRVLETIGAEQCAGEHWIAGDGSWQLGPLRGKWSKPQAEHIGESSRAAARRRQIATLRQELQSIDDEREQCRAALYGLAERRRAAAEEHAALPSDAAVRQAWFTAARITDSLPAALDRLQRAEEATTTARTARDHARRRRDVDAADVGLIVWLDRLDELRDEFAAYREALAAVWPQLHRLADVQAQQRGCRLRLQAAVTEREQRGARRRDAELETQAARSRHRALQSTVGAAAQAIIEKHQEAVRQLENVKKAYKMLAEHERQHDLERERAAADIERHAADHERHEKERGLAIERLASFAAHRLLAEADAAFVNLDRDPEWGATRPRLPQVASLRDRTSPGRAVAALDAPHIRHRPRRRKGSGADSAAVRGRRGALPVRRSRRSAPDPAR
jgi:hypothetical protein